MYKTIQNNTRERDELLLPWTYWDNAFSKGELTKMCEYFSTQGVKRGNVIGDKFGKLNTSQHINEEIRVANIRLYQYNPKNIETNWIFQRMNYIIESLNNQFYNFNINGYDYFQYAEYEGYENGRQEFHMDTIMGGSKPHNEHGTRKLSLTVLLNEPGKDFEGGDLEFNLEQEKNSISIPGMAAGRIVCFPSFMLHRVTPVTKGTRKSLVVWALGPKFI